MIIVIENALTLTQTDPKELMINDMRTQIKEMDEELQRTLKNHDQLELSSKEKNLRIETLQKEAKHLRY